VFLWGGGGGVVGGICFPLFWIKRALLAEEGQLESARMGVLLLGSKDSGTTEVQTRKVEALCSFPVNTKIVKLKEGVAERDSLGIVKNLTGWKMGEGQLTFEKGKIIKTERKASRDDHLYSYMKKPFLC